MFWCTKSLSPVTLERLLPVPDGRLLGAVFDFSSNGFYTAR